MNLYALSPVAYALNVCTSSIFEILMPHITPGLFPVCNVSRTTKWHVSDIDKLVSNSQVLLYGIPSHPDIQQA